MAIKWQGTIDGANTNLGAVMEADGGEVPFVLSTEVLSQHLDRDVVPATRTFDQLYFNRRGSSEAVQLTGSGSNILPSAVGSTTDKMVYGYVMHSMQPSMFEKEEWESGDMKRNPLDNRLKVDKMIYDQDVEYFFLNGSIRDSSGGILRTSASVAGLQTLNGTTTWSNAVTGVTDRGFMRPVVPASQTGTYVQGLADGSDYVNQYAVGPSWAAGTTQAAMLNLITQLAMKEEYDGGRGINMTVDLGIADALSYGRLLNWQHDTVRVESVEKDQFGKSRAFVPVQGVKIFASNLLNPQDSAWSTATDIISTGATDGGIIYFLASKALQLKRTVTSFSPWQKAIASQQAVTSCRITMSSQLVCHRLPLIGGLAKTRVA